MHSQDSFPRSHPRYALTFGIGALALSMVVASAANVELLRTPNGGIQPQTAVDDRGVLHLIYYKGDDRGGDLFYVRREPGKSELSKPIQVNSERGSAIAAGTIRGAQLAIGRNGRVHVVWNGGSGAAKASHPGAPMLYTRLNDAGTAFEPERDLITFAAGLDGGSSIAADSQGHVYAAWHAHAPGGKEGEAGRAVFVARSTDDGKTFSREKQANPTPTGACGCCGMRAFADRAGNVYILYRAALELTKRDEVLLVSKDHARTFSIANSDRWNTPSCPMSSAWFSQGKAGALAAWETEGQVYFASVDARTLSVSKPQAPPGANKRRHPVVVANAQGEMLVAWSEGTGWQKGGEVAWQLYDEQGRPSKEQGRADGVPVWGLVSAFAKPSGEFVLVY